MKSFCLCLHAQKRICVLFRWTTGVAVIFGEYVDPVLALNRVVFTESYMLEIIREDR